MDIVLGDTLNIYVLVAELKRHFRGDERIVLAERVTKHMVSKRREACLEAAGTERFYEARVVFAGKGLEAALAAEAAAMAERDLKRWEVMAEKVKEARALKKQCELDLREHRRKARAAKERVDEQARKRADKEAALLRKDADQAARVADKCGADNAVRAAWTLLKDLGKMKRLEDETKAIGLKKERVDAKKFRDDEEYVAKKIIEKEKRLTATLTGVKLDAQVTRCQRKFYRAVEAYDVRAKTCGEAGTYHLLCRMWVWSEVWADARKKPFSSDELNLTLELVRQRRKRDTQVD